MSNEYDLVVLGGGTGGYVAAIRASQLGMKVAVIEKDKLGGTCLHRGCIPSKSLLHSASVFQMFRYGERFGVRAEKVEFDFLKMQERKEEIVSRLYRGILHLMKKNKIDIFQGKGKVKEQIPRSTFSVVSVVKGEQGEETKLLSRFLLLATGSRPRNLPDVLIDGKWVLSSDDLLSLKQLPSSILIVGGGVIGVEWASLLNDLGVSVTIVEAAERILPGEDGDISKEMARQLTARGIKIYTSTSLSPGFYKENNLIITKIKNSGEELNLPVERILLSVGRVANVEGIGLEDSMIEIEKGFIAVNDAYQTGERNIYAIGDVIGGMQLAHVAAKEGILAVEHMAGLAPSPLDYRLVPRCVYGKPEIGSVGFTEEEARQEGYRIQVGKVPFQAIGKAWINGEESGFCKIIEDLDSHDLLGIHFIGGGATELIGEGILARMVDATAGELAGMIHPHPSLSEIIGEAALAIKGNSIHY